MGIELPEELAGVARTAGVHWPQADEDKLRASAQAWRDAGGKLDTLTTDSDGTARGTLSHMRGAAGDAADRHWSAFVRPDTGHLTATAKGCTAAADRLDHAANQVGAAKTEIVRQLVSLARNSDAAHAAAASGHPTALAGLDTYVKGTAANVATINQSLVHAVRPDSGVDVSTTQTPAQATPGEHGPLSSVDNLVQAGGHGHGHGPVTDLTQSATGLVSDTTSGHGPVHDTVLATTGVVDTTVTGHGHGPVGDLAQGGTGVVDNTVHSTTGTVDNTVAGHGHQASLVTGDGSAAGLVPGHHGVAVPVPGDISVGDTGPIPVQHPDAPTPRSGLPFPHGHNQVVSAAGLAGPVPAGLPAAPAAGLVPGAMPPNPVPPPGQVPFQGPVPPPSAGVFGPGAPGVPLGPGGPSAPLAGQPSAPLAGQPSAHRRPAGHGGVPAAPVGARPEPFAQPGPPPPAAAVSQRAAAPLKDGQFAAAVPPPAQPGAGLPPGHKTEREQLVAILLVHMFPIGHMPVAAAEPARQLPTPPPELDYAAGLRFPPDDHPQSNLVGAATPPDSLSTVEPLAPESPAVQELLRNHDPLGELHERDWDRRFLVRPAGPQGDVEYAWPPGELYPEGGSAPGEPEVLDAGTLIDRFGGEDGRVFAAADTPFPQRSLPPSHVDLGYHRYRVVAPIPVWRAVSAAWFAQPGGGVRYRTTRSAAELVALGHLEAVSDEAVDEQQTGGTP